MKYRIEILPPQEDKRHILAEAHGHHPAAAVLRMLLPTEPPEPPIPEIGQPIVQHGQKVVLSTVDDGEVEQIVKLQCDMGTLYE